MRRRRVARLALALAAVQAAVVGLPALLAPLAFYRRFPVLGGHWVDRLPSYSEHLVTDVGGLYLGFAALLAYGALRGERGLAVPVAVVWTGVTLVHLGFHVTHLGPFPPLEAALQTITLIATSATAALAALCARVLPPAGLPGRGARDAGLTAAATSARRRGRGARRAPGPPR